MKKFWINITGTTYKANHTDVHPSKVPDVLRSIASLIEEYPHQEFIIEIGSYRD